VTDDRLAGGGGRVAISRGMVVCGPVWRPLEHVRVRAIPITRSWLTGRLLEPLEEVQSVTPRLEAAWLLQYERPTAISVRNELGAASKERSQCTPVTSAADLD
jgi:hypothetical protein